MVLMEFDDDAGMLAPEVELAKSDAGGSPDGARAGDHGSFGAARTREQL
jgi:hypothetical protein